MLVMFFFISLRVLRGPSADRPETWSHGRKLSEFYNPSPKNSGGHFDREYPETAQSIANPKIIWSTTAPSTLDNKNCVNFGP